MSLGKADTFASDLLKLIFNGTAIANIADNAASSPLGTLYLSLHTASPGESPANQTINETTYTDYARVAIARTTSGWVVNTGNSPPTVSPVSNIDFPQANASMVGTVSISHACIGSAASGSGGRVLYIGAISPAITVAAGVIPRLTSATTISED